MTTRRLALRSAGCRQPLSCQKWFQGLGRKSHQQVARVIMALFTCFVGRYIFMLCRSSHGGETSRFYPLTHRLIVVLLCSSILATISHRQRNRNTTMSYIFKLGCSPNSLSQKWLPINKITIHHATQSIQRWLKKQPMIW